ncbi:MAG: TolC family protein [Acidobacteriaceae bacterium]
MSYVISRIVVGSETGSAGGCLARPSQYSGVKLPDNNTQPGETLKFSSAAKLACIGMAMLLLAVATPAQTAGGTSSVAASAQLTVSGQQAPVQLTLADALRRAKALDPAVRLALTNERIAAENPTQTRAANLPIVSYNSQYLYTEGNGTPTARYIANNGVHEYIAQVDVHQSLSVANIALYHQSIVASALVRDQAEIAQRGLVVAVVQNYATMVAAQRKFDSLQQALQVAQDFLNTTKELERGGEVAKADVVKAQIQFDDSRVALQDGQMALENARVALALMVFPDVNQSYVVVDDPAQDLLLPSLDDAEAEARQHNPALDAAFRAVRMASDAVTIAKAEYLPTMTLDYFYGIDANRFATETPSNPRIDPELNGRPIQNLGYSALASLTLPIWNWGATHSRVKTAEELKEQAVEDREFAQRKLIADLERSYGEAKVAKSEMEIRQSSMANAEESLKLTLLQYKGGNATALEVVTAQDTLTLERGAFADAQTRYATALANLATLTGSL